MSAHIGYAAMLERFPPAEAVALAALAESHGFTGRHGHRPLPAVGARAGRILLRVERARGDRRAHDRRPRPGRDDPVVPDASRRRRPGERDARRSLPGPALARHRLGRGAQRAHRGRVLARGARAHQSHVRGGRRDQAALRGLARGPRRASLGPALQARVDEALDDAGCRSADLRRGIRARDRSPRGAHRRRVHHHRCADRPARAAAHALRGGRPRSRAQSGDHAEGAATPPLVGADRRGGDAQRAA